MNDIYLWAQENKIKIVSLTSFPLDGGINIIVAYH